MKKRINIDLNDTKYTALVGRALSSPVRLDILRALVPEPSNISDLAERFGLPLSSAALHVRVLEEARLIRIMEKPGIRGSQKICSINFEDLYFNPYVNTEKQQKTHSHKYSMPIGCYFDCSVQAPCGIASDKKYIGVEDMQNGFYSAERTDAQLIWFTTGYLEYRFPNHFLKSGELIEVGFSFEICSEAPGYHMEWPSDVTVWVNSREVCTLHCTGDFGDRRGAQTPAWWNDGASQYGELRSLTINALGCFGDNIKSSDETIDSLKLAEGEFISFKLGVKADAVHAGGMNLFGERFGDYRQSIVMSVKHRVG